MSLDLDIALLSRVTLFEGFNKEHLRLLSFGADKRSFKPQSIVFRRGSYADGGLIIVSGTIDMMSDSSEEARLLGSFGPASLIGEMAMISEGNRNSTAIARDQVEVIKITRLLFHRMLEEFPDLAALLHARISQSVQDFVSRLEGVQHRLDRVDSL